MCSLTRLDSLRERNSTAAQKNVFFYEILCHLAIAQGISSIFIMDFSVVVRAVFRPVGEGHAAPAQPLVGRRDARGRCHEDGCAQGSTDVLVALVALHCIWLHWLVQML